MCETQIEFDLGGGIIVQDDLLDLDTKMSKVLGMLGASTR